MMVEPGLQEDPREKAHLAARRPFDLAAVLIEESTRAAARAVDDLRLTIMRLRTGLVELEREVLEVGERRGAAAASKIPKPQGRREREKPAVPWCSCTMYLSPHLHRDHGVPDEETP